MGQASFAEEAGDEAGGGEIFFLSTNGEVIDDGADEFEGDVGHGVEVDVKIGV